MNSEVQAMQHWNKNHADTWIFRRYHGEKLVLHSVKKVKTDHLISTVYDKPQQVDGGDSLLRRQPSTSMKYRGWQPGGSIGTKR